MYYRTLLAAACVAVLVAAARAQGPKEPASDASLADERGRIGPAGLKKVQLLLKGKGWIAKESALSRLPAAERRKYLGAREMDQKTAARFGRQPMAPKEAPPRLPSSLDYRAEGYVTPVKDQGACGSCWAFATTAALESYILRAYRARDKVLDYSEQILLSCARNLGCDDGGWITTAAEYLVVHGVGQETDYPYVADEGSCNKAAAGWEGNAIRPGNWYRVKQTAAALKEALVGYGPFPVAFTVHEDFYLYHGGVYRHVSGKQDGGHAVLLVGYDDKTSSFLCKNSWGTDPRLWGDGSGYFRIAYSEVENLGFGRDAVVFTTKPRAPAHSLFSAMKDRLDPDSKSKVFVQFDDGEMVGEKDLSGAAPGFADGAHVAKGRTPEGRAATIKFTVKDGALGSIEPEPTP